jgi:hypothetical protein
VTRIQGRTEAAKWTEIGYQMSLKERLGFARANVYYDYYFSNFHSKSPVGF